MLFVLDRFLVCPSCTSTAGSIVSSGCRKRSVPRSFSFFSPSLVWFDTSICKYELIYPACMSFSLFVCYLYTVWAVGWGTFDGTSEGDRTPISLCVRISFDRQPVSRSLLTTTTNSSIDAQRWQARIDIGDWLVITNGRVYCAQKILNLWGIECFLYHLDILITSDHDAAGSLTRDITCVPVWLRGILSNRGSFAKQSFNQNHNLSSQFLRCQIFVDFCHVVVHYNPS